VERTQAPVFNQGSLASNPEKKTMDTFGESVRMGAMPIPKTPPADHAARQHRRGLQAAFVGGTAVAVVVIAVLIYFLST
jgi:hypothetical protein